MAITKDDLVRDLRRLGIEPGDLLFVHSSLSRIGWVEGGAETVISALREAVGPDGTLGVPTLTGYPENAPDYPPAFDARETPCWTGRIPETLRQLPDALRSAHPTHSVAAVGKGAVEFINGHENAETPCGPGSPYEKLADRGGKVLLLGVDHSCNTLLHYVEEIARSPYHLQPEPAVVTFTDGDGQSLPRKIRLHDWAAQRNFNRIEPLLISEGAETVGKVGEATARLIQAGTMVRLVLARMVQDPHLLLSDTERLRRTENRIPIRIEQMEHAEGLPIPSYATPGAAGMDLHAANDEEIRLEPGERTLVPTGLKIAVPHGYEAQIRPRSGLAAKQGVTCLNSPGTIDSDYRGECKVIVINHSKEPVIFRRGDRIAQMVIAAVTLAEWEVGPVEEDTARGAGGFGHTGVSP